MYAKAGITANYHVWSWCSKENDQAMVNRLVIDHLNLFVSMNIFLNLSCKYAALHNQNFNNKMSSATKSQHSAALGIISYNQPSLMCAVTLSTSHLQQLHVLWSIIIREPLRPKSVSYNYNFSSCLVLIYSTKTNICYSKVQKLTKL